MQKLRPLLAIGVAGGPGCRYLTDEVVWSVSEYHHDGSSKMNTMAVTPTGFRIPVADALPEAVQRLVASLQPEKIILFGSAARGKMGPNSDVDLLVIKRGKYHRRRRVTGKIYRNMFGVGQAVDVIVVTPEEVEKYRDTHCLVIKPALQEGREVYHA